MLVMKFGGASVKDAASVKNVAEIIKGFEGTPLLVVVSAMGKMTNQLEILAGFANDQKEKETWLQFESIVDFHSGIIKALFENAAIPVLEKVNAWFLEIEKIARGVLLLGEFPANTYARIVAFGELLATEIVSQYLEFAGIRTALVDSRELIRTDASFKQANVIWSLTRENIRRVVPPLFDTHSVVIAPGFIASSTDGKVTTLGREGSDFSAAIFASCLGAEKMIVWKDVPGIMSGDPRSEKQVEKIGQLSYEEAVEMTFYGATVLHPKTIKPLSNAGIPLFVKSFLDTKETGSIVSEIASTDKAIITSRLSKKNLALLTLTSRDFSFMDEALLGIVFTEISHTGLNLSLVQTTAIHLYLVVNFQEESLQQFESRLRDRFEIKVQPDMNLRTIVNFNLSDLSEARGAALVQQAENKLFIVKKAEG